VRKLYIILVCLALALILTVPTAFISRAEPPMHGIGCCVLNTQTGWPFVVRQTATNGVGEDPQTNTNVSALVVNYLIYLFPMVVIVSGLMVLSSKRKSGSKIAP